MAFQGFKSEFKSIQTVWVLNALPPGLGFGTIYACGPLATLLVLPGLAYIIHNHMSIESLITSYVLLSVLGTLGAVYHNLKLATDLSVDTTGDADTEQSGAEKSFALDSFERKLAMAELMLKNDRKEVLEMEVEKPGFESGIIVGEDQIAVSDREEQEALVKLFSEDGLKSVADEVDLAPVLEAMPEKNALSDISKIAAVVEPTLEAAVQMRPAFSEPDMEVAMVSADVLLPESVEVPAVTAALSDDERVEVDTVLKKLGEATGEFQPEVNAGIADAFNVAPFENYQFSPGYEQFKLELPTAFESAFQTSIDTESKKSIITCGDCGSELNPSFSFCLACGKVL
ncbi:hypothetical protein GC174_02885 [bacterium]|nr:hypothetical protein [bacterium]